jgi:hypothetical protein
VFNFNLIVIYIIILVNCHFDLDGCIALCEEDVNAERFGHGMRLFEIHVI